MQKKKPDEMAQGRQKIEVTGEGLKVKKKAKLGKE